MGSPLNITGKNTFLAAYAGKRVLVTGHTGFKGAWLTLTLKRRCWAIYKCQRRAGSYQPRPSDHPLAPSPLETRADPDWDTVRTRPEFLEIIRTLDATPGTPEAVSEDDLLGGPIR